MPRTKSIYGGLTTYGTIVIDVSPAGALAVFAGIVSSIGQVGAILAPVVNGYPVRGTGSFGAGFAFMGAALFAGGACAVTLVPAVLKQDREQHSQ